MLADARPLRVILGRPRVHGRVAPRREILDGHAQTEERLHAVFGKRLHERIRIGETVVFRIRLVGIEIWEEVRDIDEQPAAKPAPYIMETRIRYSRLLEIVEHHIVFELAHERRLPDGVDGLDRPCRTSEINLHLRRRQICTGYGQQENTPTYHICRLFSHSLHLSITFHLSLIPYHLFRSRHFENRTIGTVAMLSDKNASGAISRTDSRRSLSLSLTMRLNRIPSSSAFAVNPEATSYGTSAS